MSGCPRIPRCRTCFSACLMDAGAKAKEAEAGIGRLSLITMNHHYTMSMGPEALPLPCRAWLRTRLPTTIESAPQRHLTGAKTTSWGHLPRKDQLIVITLALARLSEPLVQTSLQWFNPDLPDSTIAGQAGILHDMLAVAVADLQFQISASFTAAQFLTAMLWGISEIIKEKKYQSRAFLPLPMTFNIGIIIGPILGGLLSDPAGTYPDRFGKINFFTHFPYAAPNILSATLDSGAMVRDRSLELEQKLWRCFSRGDTEAFYALLASTDSSAELELGSAIEERKSSVKPTYGGAGKHHQVRRRYTQRLPFRRIFTRNVSFTLVANFLLAFHVGTFNSLWFVFLTTPVYDPTKAAAPPNALAYNPMSAELFAAAKPKGRHCSLGGHGRSATLQVAGRTFVLPAQTILVNNCTPHPGVLGTVHGIGQSVSSFARTLGPMLCGFSYGLGLNIDIVGASWWGLSAVALLEFLASLSVWEGDGHEIWLEGDNEDDM
ncbi:hypothetical protein NEUTE1DRAFT_113111 [Neurospora tetrasperma FGSC 2508]|uniref:MFS general substrate transporter n=1 Tax=Neurospora tetrasperma (strain FGSC 2508 / ATCC MYA-4615 / P0657) TaxID=510951 RepID=F8MV13_NEUT8|nr:uncharacterized protein NEUTE1DRAFT_113111 [Neurospora tetrasperma FGSC 2508]EGO54638.1 hypothetical protein NEUTE1DRAFT_113111 [Neurospora tetrasperma FGSC 2508]